MLRQNNICEGIISEFQNHNLYLKLSSEAIENINSGRNSDIEIISYLLDSLDCYFIGDQGCAGNFDMYIQIYNLYSDRIYLMLLGRDIETLKEGKHIILYSRIPDKDDRELIESEYNDQ